MSDALIARIQRLLVLVPYVAARPEGVPIQDVVRFAGYAREADLYPDLDLLQLIGAPPAGPDDLVDIYVERDRVFVVLPQGFKRPPRLSVIEAAALLAAAESLRDAAAETLARAAQKLQTALPPGSAEALDELGRAAAIDASPPPACLATLEKAIADRIEVRVDYWSASTDQKRVRRLFPRAVFLHRGRWYLAAWDAEGNEDKLYRLDRVASVALGERRFGERKDIVPRYDQADVLLFGSHARTADLVFSSAAAPRAREGFGAAATPNRDGTVTVKVPISGQAWLVGWIVGQGGEARADGPDDLRAEVARTARALLARYASD